MAARAGVPLILSWPGALPQGARCDRVCNLVDLGATFADAAGAYVGMLRDHIATNGATFAQDVPNGDYEVTVYHNGDLLDVVDASI